MTTETQPKVKRHPIRGALWGLLGGIGVALILINFAVIALGTMMPWIVIGVFIVLGILWGMFAPAKKPKGDPPASASVDDAPAEAQPDGEVATAPVEPEADDTPAPEDEPG